MSGPQTTMTKQDVWFVLRMAGGFVVGTVVSLLLSRAVMGWGGGRDIQMCAAPPAAGQSVPLTPPVAQTPQPLPAPR